MPRIYRGPDYYGRDGEPMTMLEWSEKFNNMEYKRVAEDTIPDTNTWVSTVWVGIALTGREPLIFETQTFSDMPKEDEYIRRYPTEQEAIEGHMEIVDRLTRGLGLEEA